MVGKAEDKLGIRASSTCELLLDEVKVPASQVMSHIHIHTLLMRTSLSPRGMPTYVSFSDTHDD